MYIRTLVPAKTKQEMPIELSELKLKSKPLVFCVLEPLRKPITQCHVSPVTSFATLNAELSGLKCLDGCNLHIRLGLVISVCWTEMPFADLDNIDILNCTDTNSFFLESSLNELNVSKDKGADTTMMQVTDIKHIRNNSRKECIIASLNINSLPNKFEEIKEWLGSNLFDILAIQETKIDSTFPNSQFNVEGI